MTTGQLIQAARKAAGLTQVELGEKLGISGSALAQYETGKRNPKYETLIRIATALNNCAPGLNIQAPDLFCDNYTLLPNKDELLPYDFSDFGRFIETFGYYIRRFGDNYHLHNGTCFVELTPDELKRLVRSSRKTVAALLDAMMEEAEDNTPAPETPPEAASGPTDTE